MGLTELLIFIGALLGGYVSGLTGFGTGLTALPIFLFVVQPVVAGPIVIICALVAQIQTLPSVWRFIPWKKALPFLISAFLGVPIGTLALSQVSSDNFRLGIGVVLVIYSSFMLLRGKFGDKIVVNGNRISDALVGLGGGFLGGVAGLSGVLPTLWISLRNWGKDTKRGFFQGFNLVVLFVSLVFMQQSGYVTSDVAKLLIAALPGTLLGAVLGRYTYSRLSDARFDLLVLVVFLLSGLAMILLWGLVRL